MHLVDFPGCCTAKILTGFGQTVTAEGRYRPAAKVTLETMKAELMEKLSTLKRWGNIALVFATTNSDQVIAAQVFEEAGFIKTNEVEKNQHADKKLTGWYIELGKAAVPAIDPKFVYNPFDPPPPPRAAVPPAPPVMVLEQPQQYDIRVGDVVRVLPSATKEEYNHGGPGWAREMARFIGELSEVRFPTGGLDDCYRLSNSWNWKARDLALVWRNGRDANGRFAKKPI